MKRAYSNNLFETGNTIIPKTMKNLGLLKEYKKNQIFYKWGYIVGKEIEKHISRNKFWCIICICKFVCMGK